MRMNGQARSSVHLYVVFQRKQHVFCICCSDHSMALPKMRRVSVQGNFYLENLTEVAVDSVSDAMALYWEAMSHKVVAVHDMNDASSRSHVVLQLTVTSAPAAARDEQHSANLVLVDLAGCERQDQTGIQPTPGAPEDDTQGPEHSGKATQAESIAINKSLMVLRQVVAARSVQDSEKGHAETAKSHRTFPLTHIPYRDSKLTSLLKSGLSGSGRMLMIACIAPSQQHVEGTISSLEYACLVWTCAILKMPCPCVDQKCLTECRRWHGCMCQYSTSR